MYIDYNKNLSITTATPLWSTSRIIWSANVLPLAELAGNHEGVMAKRDHILQEGDVIELHM